MIGAGLGLSGLFLYDGIRPSYDNILQKLNAIINKTLQDIEKLKEIKKQAN